MQRFLPLLILLGLFLVGCTTLEPGAYYVIPAEGSITPDYQYCQGSDCWMAQLITRAPQATVTPVPTNTPVVTLPFPSPTPEVTVLPTIPATPFPKPSPTPEPGKCSVIVTADPNLRVRATPNGTVLGLVNKGDILAPEGYWDLGGVKWYQIYWLPEQKGYIAASYTTLVTGADCSKLPNVAPTAKIPAAWLIHVVPGYNVMELNATYPTLAAAGVGFGIKTYAGAERCAETLLYGGICILRIPLFGTDCPEMGSNLERDPVQSAKDWMNEYKRLTSSLWGYRSTGRFYIELTNECRFGSENDPGPVYWWASWLKQASLIFLADTSWPPVVVPTYGPGDGDSVFAYVAWKEGLTNFASRGSLLGFHDYTPEPPGSGQGLCACDEWLGCRHRRNYQALKLAGITMRYAITEAARGWGSSPVDVQDFLCWYNKIKHDEGLHSVAAWTGGFGGDPRWGVASLDGYYQTLAAGVVQSLK